MKDKKSIYRCNICGKETKETAGRDIPCEKCGYTMEEVVKGIIVK